MLEIILKVKLLLRPNKSVQRVMQNSKISEKELCEVMIKQLFNDGKKKQICSEDLFEMFGSKGG